MYYSRNTTFFLGDLMKIAIVLLSLVMATNVFANSVAESTLMTSLSPGLTSLSLSAQHKAAAQILNDAQELIQDGTMSAFLEQSIKEVQNKNAVSEGEALDILISHSQEVLAN